MSERRLTDRTLKAIKSARAGARYEVMDHGTGSVGGLGVRVTDKGKRTFVLIARYPGSRNPTRRALGEYPQITLEEARAKARKWHSLLNQGIDPRADDERQKLADQRRAENSFEAVTEDFIRLAVIGPKPDRPKQRKGTIVARELRSEFVGRWGRRPIDTITPHDVVAVLDEAVARGAPYQAHNLLGHVRRLFNWAIARGVYGIDRSPCDRMKPSDVIGRKLVRTRTLNDDELLAFWLASEGLGYPFGPMFRLLALTGQRKSEVGDAQWTEFDLKKRLWTIPPERMKGDAAHVLPLTDEL